MALLTFQSRTQGLRPSHCCTGLREPVFLMTYTTHHAAVLQELDAGAEEQAPDGIPSVQPSARSEPSLATSLAPSGGSSTAVQQQQSQLQHHDQGQEHVVETSFRSAGHLGLRPAAAATQVAPRPTTAPSYRPAAIHSARGAEYYNRPPASARSAGDSEADSSGVWRGAGSTGSTGSLPAHNRLYADHFRKQKRLEEERRLRCGPLVELSGAGCHRQGRQAVLASTCLSPCCTKLVAVLCPRVHADFGNTCALPAPCAHKVHSAPGLHPTHPPTPSSHPPTHPPLVQGSRGAAEDGAGAHCAHLQQAGGPPHRRLLPQLRGAALRGGQAGRHAARAGGGRRGARRASPARVGWAGWAGCGLCQRIIGRLWACRQAALIPAASRDSFQQHDVPSAAGPVVAAWCPQAQRLKEEEAHAELEGYTFQPSISKLAQQLKQAEGGCTSSLAAGQRLYQRAQGTAKRQVGSAMSTTAVSRLRRGEGGSLPSTGRGPAAGWCGLGQAARQNDALVQGTLASATRPLLCPALLSSVARKSTFSFRLCPLVLPAVLQERMEAIRREQDAAEVAECSFRPQINANSARMVEQRQQILRVRGARGGCACLSTCPGLPVDTTGWSAPTEPAGSTAGKEPAGRAAGCSTRGCLNVLDLPTPASSPYGLCVSLLCCRKVGWRAMSSCTTTACVGA